MDFFIKKFNKIVQSSDNRVDVKMRKYCILTDVEKRQCLFSTNTHLYKEAAQPDSLLMMIDKKI